MNGTRPIRKKNRNGLYSAKLRMIAWADRHTYRALLLTRRESRVLGFTPIGTDSIAIPFQPACTMVSIV